MAILAVAELRARCSRSCGRVPGFSPPPTNPEKSGAGAENAETAVALSDSRSKPLAKSLCMSQRSRQFQSRPPLPDLVETLE